MSNIDFEKALNSEQLAAVTAPDGPVLVIAAAIGLWIIVQRRRMKLLQAAEDELRTTNAHLERAIQDLSDVVYRQQQDLDRVREMNRQLSLQIDEVASRADDPSVQERPPHY